MLDQLLKSSIGNITVERLLSAVFSFVVCYLAIKIITKGVNRLLERAEGKMDLYLRNIIRTAVKVVLYVVTAMIVVSALGVDTTSLIAVFSVVGLAVSLAVQNTLTNVAGGLMILLTKPFTVGDFIETGSLSGTAVEIGISYTRLQTPDNKIISIPNGDLANTRITDYSANRTRRVDLTYTASYDAPVATVKLALGEAMDEVGLFLEEPARQIEVMKYGDSSIEYVVRGWVENENYWPAYFAMNTKVAETFARHQVEMTYNHLNVHLKQ